jgi:hypothetical protein
MPHVGVTSSHGAPPPDFAAKEEDDEQEVIFLGCVEKHKQLRRLTARNRDLLLACSSKGVYRKSVRVLFPALICRITGEVLVVIFRQGIPHPRGKSRMKSATTGNQITAQAAQRLTYKKGRANAELYG